MKVVGGGTDYGVST